jgi:hypothetical protein
MRTNFYHQPGFCMVGLQHTTGVFITVVDIAYKAFFVWLFMTTAVFERLWG